MSVDGAATVRWASGTSRSIGRSPRRPWYLVIFYEFFFLSNTLYLQFTITNVVTIFIPLWGMIGIWTTKFGYVRTAFSPFRACSLPANLQLPQRLGVLGVQRRVRPLPGAVLRLLADDDGRAHPARVRQHGACPLLPSSPLPADRACSSSACSGSPTARPR